MQIDLIEKIHFSNNEKKELRGDSQNYMKRVFIIKPLNVNTTKQIQNCNYMGDGKLRRNLYF